MQTEYIDVTPRYSRCTPTWSDLMPSLIQVAVNGKNWDSVVSATNSLRHMARQADKIADLEQQNRDLLDALHTMVSVMQYEARISNREKELMPLCNQASELLAKVAA